MILIFLLTALLIGATVVYLVPYVNGWVGKVPGASKVANNKFANMLLIGLIVLAALHISFMFAKKV